jgi:hypothetical protein
MGDNAGLSARDVLNMYYGDKVAVNNIRNVMGCNESWYDPYFAITHTFSRDYINLITDQQLNDLIALAENIQEALY